MLLPLAALAGLAWWSSTSSARPRRATRGRRGGLAGPASNKGGELLTEYEENPRAGARRPCGVDRFVVKVGRRCDQMPRSRKELCDVWAEAETVDGRTLASVEAIAVEGKPYLSVQYASAVGGGRSMSPSDGDVSGCGIGTKLYEALAEYACNEGLILRSDEELSEKSRSFWEKQVRKGRAYKDRKRFALTHSCLPTTDLSGADRYIRKKKGYAVDEKAFWDDVRGKGAFKRSAEDDKAARRTAVDEWEANLPKGLTAEERQARKDAAFWAKVNRDYGQRKSSKPAQAAVQPRSQARSESLYESSKDARRPTVEELLEARRKRFELTDKLNREDEEDYLRRKKWRLGPG